MRGLGQVKLDFMYISVGQITTWTQLLTISVMDFFFLAIKQHPFYTLEWYDVPYST